MDDASFEELRNALAPERESTSRQGALFVLEMSLDGDDDFRIPGLIATLLSDRDTELSAKATALVLKRQNLANELEREVQRAWALSRPGYRQHLISELDPTSLVAKSMDFADQPDVALKFGLLERLRDLGEEFDARDALLFMTMDDNAELRAAAAELLLRAPSTPANAAITRLLKDADEAVRLVAVKAAHTILASKARETLSAMQKDESFEVRGAVADALQALRRSDNLRVTENLIAEQRQAIDDENWTAVMGIASQVFMKVPNHPECQYHMARACCGMGDFRRASRLLLNVFKSGFGSRDEVMSDPLLRKLTDIPAWDELIAQCPQ